MSIIQNKKAFHDFFIEEKFEAGLVLEGWEVKSIRAGRVQLKESYVIIKQGAIWLIGCHISPLPTASTHVHPDPTRIRKLLLKGGQIDKLIGKVERAGRLHAGGAGHALPQWLGQAGNRPGQGQKTA